jgi:hypothetical protein
MAAAVHALWAELTPATVDYGTAMFRDPLRVVWDYNQANRSGMPLFALESADRERLWSLLEVALGGDGLRRVRDVIALERYVFETTRDETRDPDWYLLEVFGPPGDAGNWGWSFEGHHVSLNFTIRDGHVIGTTPAFLGSQPATLSTGTREIEPLAVSAAAGRALLDALDASQRRRAVFASEPPDDILTLHDSRAFRPNLLGVRYGDLSGAQQRLMDALIASYANRFSAELAETEIAAIAARGLDDVRFGWAGPGSPGAAYYYRVQGPEFLIEYGHVDGELDHVHSVWRKFDDDFGRRVLRDAAPTTTTLAPSTPTPASAEETAAAAAAAHEKLELLDEAVGANGCQAVAEVLNRRPLLAGEELPRNFYRSDDLEVMRLRVTATTDTDALENLCVVGDEIDAISPRHPSRLTGAEVALELELTSDGQVSVWRASRIRLR